jgi:polyferredoxin
MNTQLPNLIGLVLSASISLMGVSVTLVALVPVLIEIARGRSPNFFAGEEAKNNLVNYLNKLCITIVIFGFATLVSGIDLYFVNIYMFIISAISFSVGLILLLIISLAMAKQTIGFID